MTFQHALAYLASAMNETASRRVPHRLDRMRRLLAELGDPQAAYPTIHVGGTSGKGSTATMIASVLQAAGKKTGLHTKPHLVSVVERARIGGVPISEDEFGELMSDMMPAIDRTTAEFGRPSYYETLLGLAFLWFAQQHVDVAVIEVGIGGKLDGTNVIVPQVAVITNVGYDHMDVLGDTLEEIAADKAGIAKPGVPLVTAADRGDARATIEKRCAEVGAPFFLVQDAARVETQSASTSGQHFRITTERDAYDVQMPTLGEFQRTNAATAIVALERLKPPLAVTSVDVEAGLANVAITGRMEYFPGFPAVIFDIAHNPDKADHLVRSLRATFPAARFHILLAVSESKDANEILRAFAALPASYTFTEFETQGRNPVRAGRLASLAEAEGFWGRAIADPIEAFAVARRSAPSESVVVVTGSTFLVAELRAWFLDNVAAQTTAP